VDQTGKEINSNRFIALMVTAVRPPLPPAARQAAPPRARWLQAAVTLREFPGTTVVTDRWVGLYSFRWL
jgi:hypothetical protein